MNENILHSEIISRMLKAYGIPEKWGATTVLAEKLKTKASVVSGWRARGVPIETIAKVSRDTGVPVRWIETGEGDMAQAGHTDPAIEALVREAVPQWRVGDSELTANERRFIIMMRAISDEHRQILLDTLTEMYFAEMERREGTK